MKIKLSLAIIALLALIAPTAKAQYGTFSVQTLISGQTNNLAVISTNVYSLTMDVRRQSHVGIQVTGSLVLSNYANVKLYLQPSVDGSTYETQNLMVVQALGATNALAAGKFIACTNLPVEGLHSLRLYSIGNLDTISVVTNLGVTYSVKR